MHEFEAFEDAAIARLETLKAEGLKTLAPYAGELNTDDLEAVTILFPAIYVVAPGIAVKTINKFDDATQRLILMVADQNTRGNAAAARGDAHSPGVYHLLDRCRTLLHRRPLVAGWSPLRLTGESALVYNPESGLCIYTAEYQAQTSQ